MRYDVKAVMYLDPKELESQVRVEVIELILKEIRTIELDLGTKNRVNSKGLRMTDREYRDWRKTAIYNMNEMTARYRIFKQAERQARYEYAKICAAYPAFTINQDEPHALNDR